MEKYCKYCIVGCFHLYECFGSVGMLFGPMCERFDQQDSGEVNDATDGEIRTDSEPFLLTTRSPCWMRPFLMIRLFFYEDYDGNPEMKGHNWISDITSY